LPQQEANTSGLSRWGGGSFVSRKLLESRKATANAAFAAKAKAKGYGAICACARKLRAINHATERKATFVAIKLGGFFLSDFSLCGSLGLAFCGSCPNCHRC